jgi:hypothetical protein
MRDHYLAAAAMTLIALCAINYAAARDNATAPLKLKVLQFSSE